MQRRITGILCVWVGAIALWAAAGSLNWLVSKHAVGGLTAVSLCDAEPSTCEPILYNRMDQMAPALSPIHTTIRHSEGERLFTMLGSYTHLLAQCAAILLFFTGFAGLLEIGLEGRFSLPRVSLLLLASLLMVSLAFLSAVPLDNVLGRLLHHAETGYAVPLHLFGVLIGVFGSALVWQPIRGNGEILPNQRLQHSLL